jgi:hypothetical protein
VSGSFYSAVYISLFLIGITSIALFVISAICVIRNILDKDSLFVNLVAPVIVFFPQLLSDRGKRCRKRLFLFGFLALTAAGTAFYLETEYGKPPYMNKTEYYNGNTKPKTG